MSVCLFLLFIFIKLKTSGDWWFCQTVLKTMYSMMMMMILKLSYHVTEVTCCATRDLFGV